MLDVSTFAAVASSKSSQGDLAIDAIDATANDSTYALATFLLDIVDKILKPLGLGGNATAETVVYAIVVFALSVIVG